ncbi:hypothetical protein [Ramlibacter sp. AN1133]|uniref:hypothetical protein n=1 Tax=Ramlibacter sp. AN1133 TaxID=3133429 RepID=UPI0030C04F94
MNLLDAIAVQLPPLDAFARASTRRRALPQDVRATAAAAASVKPVLQFGLAPMALDLKRYADARSNSRPDGDLRALAAFRDLVDPVPSFTRFYASSGMSTERLYESILEGATLAADSPFTARLFADARAQFEADTFANMDGTPGRWRPVYAVPDDWSDLSIEGRFQDLAVDLPEPQGGGGGAYAMIGDPAPLGLSVSEPAGIKTSSDPATTIHSFRMKYLPVFFNRPWFRYELFQAGGWLLSQQRSGYCSSGDLHDNGGVFPLLPTGMLLGRDIALDASWGHTDRAVLSSALARGTQVSLGPFSLNAAASPTDVQVVAWTSSLVPFSPRQSNVPGP